MNTRFSVVDGKLVVGAGDCYCALYSKPGHQCRIIPCTECNGTGRGKRGGIRGCKKCNGTGNSYDHDNPIVCKICNGNWKGTFPGCTTDYLPKEIWDTFTFKVYRYNGDVPLLMGLTGIGTIFTVTDYGEAVETPDDKLIEKVRKCSSHQACNFVKSDKDLTMPDHIAIIVKKNGYVVMPVFPDQITETKS